MRASWNGFCGFADMALARTSGKRRPALWTALCFGAGVILAHYVPVPPVLLLVLFLALVLVALIAALKGRHISSLLLGLLLLLGALRYQADTLLLPANHLLNAGLFGTEGIFHGRVAEEPEWQGERIRFALELEAVETDSAFYRVSGRVLVNAREVEVQGGYGARLALQGRLLRPPARRNPGAFDYRAFLALQHIHGILYLRRPGQVVEVEERLGSLFYECAILPLRRAIREIIQRNLRGAPAGLLQGMLLGEKHRIPEEVHASFRSTGLAHALVISGLHVGLITVFFFTGFRLCRLSDRWTAAATIGVLVAYAFVTQLQPPVVRASLMASVILLGRVLGRRGDIYNSLGLAALLILAVWPTSLLSLSFQLSFAATLAIVGLHGPIAALFPSSWRRQDCWIGQWVISPLCVSLAAQVGTAPLIAYHFQQFAPIAPLANLVVVPLLGLVVGLGLLSVLGGWWLPLSATAFNACNYLVLRFLLDLVDLFAAIPFAAVDTARPGWGFVVGSLALGALLWWLPASRRFWKAGLFALLIGLNVMLWSPLLRGRDLEVFFLDVGQGDGVFLRFPNGKTMVVDAGARSAHFDHGARVLLPFLRYYGVGRIDVVVASHPHSDHIGGLVTLLEKVEVGHYLDSGQIYDSWTAKRLQTLIRERGICYHRVAAGDSLVGLGGVSGVVLHPTGAFVDSAGVSPHNLNNGSVVLRLDYGAASLLLTGDIEEESDGAMLAWGRRLRAGVLKVAHHGSRTSSRPHFVAAVAPQIAVVSVGSFNKFGHPAAAVMQHFEAAGVQVYRTDRHGAIALRTDGQDVEVRTMLEPAEKMLSETAAKLD